MLQRTEPRISVNKLGEYSATNDAARRHRIIQDQKSPQNCIVPFYTPAQETITDFLVQRNSDEQMLFEEAEQLRNTRASSSWWENRNRSCAEALEAFSDVANKLNLERYELYRGSLDPPKLIVNGIVVSVRPEIILAGQNRSGKQIEGAVKLYINKNYPMSDKAGSYTATMLHQYVHTHPFTQGYCEYKSCYVVDVFGNRVFAAPRNYKRLRKSIDKACKEISRAWDDI